MALLPFSLAGITDALTPRGGYRVTPDIAYGPAPRQRIDLYEAGSAGPLVCFFHGGAWRGGERAEHRFVAEAFTSAGIDCAIAGYRVFPEAGFAGFMRDAADAVLALGRPVVLAGHSAGAHIAMLLALDPQWLPPGLVRGAIGLAGPYDFLPLTDPRHVEVLDGPHGLAATQPISFAHLAGPPLLLATGSLDRVVRPRNTQRLAGARRGVCGGGDASARPWAFEHPGFAGAAGARGAVGIARADAAFCSGFLRGAVSLLRPDAVRVVQRRGRRALQIASPTMPRPASAKAVP